MFNRLTKTRIIFNQLRSLSRYSKNNQIFIHDISNNNYKFCLTSNPTSLPIGYSKTKDPSPQDFQPEDQFLPILHKLISEEIQNDFSFIMEAGMNVSSFMPIYDFREIPEYARIPEVDSIFGYVQVDDKGKIIPSTYQANDSYRLIDGINGLIKLSDFLYDKMQSQCNNHKVT